MKPRLSVSLCEYAKETLCLMELVLIKWNKSYWGTFAPLGLVSLPHIKASKMANIHKVELKQQIGIQNRKKVPLSAHVNPSISCLDKFKHPPSN